MREIFYSILIFCFIITIFSCGKTTEENFNDTVSKTNENIEGILEDNNDTIATDTSSDNPSIKFFKKIIPGDGDGNTVNYCYLGADIKQTDDGGYIIAGCYDRKAWLMKTDVYGENNGKKHIV